MPLWSLYAFLGALSAAVVGILSKAGIKGVDATVATSIRGFVIALSMGLAALFYGKWETLSIANGRSILFIVLAGVFGGLSWWWGFLALSSGGEATVVNAIDRLSIVLILFLAIFFLGEAFTWQKLFGVCLIVIGVVITSIPKEQLVNTFHRFFS